MIPAAAILLCALAAHAVPRPLQPPAAELPGTDLWVNAKPLTLKRLHGRRVAVVAFINSANLNSLRALAVLKAWDERYALSGLSILGVHTPLYGFQRDPHQVSAALERLGVTFPVVLDDDRSLWNAYAVEGWPAFYLIDSRGKIVYDLLGEGGYAAFEDELRNALDDAGYKTQGADIAQDPPVNDCGAATPELSLAAAAVRRTKIYDIDDQDSAALPPAGELIVSSRDGEVQRAGPWRREAESLRLTASNKSGGSFVRVICRGAQVFAILTGPRAGKVARFFVRQDGLWLHSGNAGADVQFDDDGRSYVAADAARLYWLVKNPDDNEHSLTLAPEEKGAGLLGFQFSDRCLLYKP